MSRTAGDTDMAAPGHIRARLFSSCSVFLALGCAHPLKNYSK